MKEETVHRAIVAYLRVRGCLFMHIPNESRATHAWRKKQAALGLLAGAPDLVVVLPGKVLFIEIKSATGRQTASQKAFEAAVTKLGHQYSVVRSIDDMEAALEL